MSTSKLYDEIGSFTAMPNWAIEMGDKIGTDGLVLLMALRYHSGVNGEIFPAYDLLQVHTGLNRHQIARAIRKLESLKIIERQKRFGQSTIYRLKNLLTPNSSAESALMEETPVVPNMHYSSAELTLSVVQNQHSNKTHLTRLNQQDSLTDDDYGEIFTAYQNNIGVVYSVVLKDKIIDAVKEYGKEWVIKAIEIAAVNGVRKWPYIEKVLGNFERDGFRANKPAAQPLAGFRGPNE